LLADRQCCASLRSSTIVCRLLTEACMLWMEPDELGARVLRGR
jgi:hypothetical protein